MALVVQDSVSIAANTRNNDVLSGFRNALIDPQIGGAIVAIYFTASATGLVAESFVGQRNAVERSQCSLQNRFPLVPDDLVAGNIASLPNERITMPVENVTGGALTFFFRIEIEELPRRR